MYDILNGPGPFPGILDLWGGGGGLLEYRSALLASRGYVCLALEYFKTGQMKSTDMAFDYFEKAYNVLKDHPQVIPNRIGIISLCLGTIVSLNLVAESTEIKPRCLVCVSNVISKSPGKSLEGFHRSLPSEFNKIRLDENNYQIWRDVGLAVLKEPTMKVDVAKIDCPTMLVNGCDDQFWCSVETADEITETMRAAGKGHLLTRLDYPETGHLIEPPFSPHCRFGNFVLYSSNETVIQLYGGKTKPHSDAQEDSWRKILSFLQLHLYSRAKM